MTLSEINTKISQWTTSDTTAYGYPTATRLIDVNNWNQKVVSTMIYTSQDENDFDDQRSTSYPIETTPMGALQREYPIPVSEKVVGIKRVDISWDGGSTWKRATPIDSGEIEVGMGRFTDTTAEATLDSYFDREHPRYDTKYNSIFVYPKATATDVANGALIQVEWEKEVTPITSDEWTAGTVVPGFDTAFHELLWIGPASEYAAINNLPSRDDLKRMLAESEARLKLVYGKKQKDRDYQLVPEYQSYK